MRKFNYTALLFVALLTAFSFSTARAQGESPPLDAPNQNFDKKPRPSLMAELNLSKEQMQQIKIINQEKKSQMREALERLRDANRNLDEEIYADTIDEADIQARLKEVQAAHAEVSKLRSMTELAVRRILKPEQLVRFREVRQRFMERREERQNPPRDRRRNNPNRQMNNQDRPFNNRPPRPRN